MRALLAIPLALAVQMARPAPAAAADSPAVDASTMKGKVLVGYQGWFDCPMGGAGSGIRVAYRSGLALPGG